ncbi:hypothetical protein DPEC_G00286940 [Dallia pectoralis]|uniref:Uncharacterized protein n=1 Tax=Dallia pectoralis TaxID=75939 RepID=A0ACC2FK07_DALPE|nr:hypothetical protein DPEC_G00286940 [Dallia pectoralis]
MDRYNDVKVLLKTWEQSFVKEHQRKPNKDDIDEAPEETRNLYKEYRTLKQGNEKTKSSDPLPSVQNDSVEKQSDCWGSHLNRKSMPVATPELKLTSRDRDSLQASAQYFGMKLKSNLGTLTKERPLSLKKSFTPGRTPLTSWKDGRSPNPTSGFADGNTPLSPLPRPANTCPAPVGSPIQTKTGELLLPPAEEPSDPLPAFTPSKASPPAFAAPFSSGKLTSSRANHLRQTFTHRLTSVDSSWLQRCQVFDELGDEAKPVAGNLSPDAVVVAMATGSPRSKGDGEGETAGDTASTVVTSSRQSELAGLRGPGAFRTTTPRTTAPDEQQAGGRITRAADSDDPGPTGQPSSLGSGSGDADDGETRPGLGGSRAEGGMTEETAVCVATARKSVVRARKGRGGGGEEEVGGNERGHGETGEEEVGGNKLEKGAKKNGRKRRREVDTDEEKPDDAEKGGRSVKKRRRNKKPTASTADGFSPSKKPRAKKKKSGNGDASDQEDSDVTGKGEAKQIPRVPKENLLGEVDEEDVKAARSRRNNTVRPKPTTNSDGNFVKINLKKKSHVKGYACRGAGLRKQMYMEKFQLKGERFGGPDSRFRGGFGGRGRGGFRGGFSRQGDTCFKCGGTGHWAMNCKGRVSGPVDCTAPADEEASATPEEPFDLPTLEEVARATGTLRSTPLVAPPSVRDEIDSPGGKQEENADVEVLLNVMRPDYERPPPPPPMEPLYPPGEDGKVPETPSEVYEALKDFGYKSFRPGQEQAIMRILSGLSTLVVLSTGMGKSLCYQLPAYLYAQRSSSITLVVSPLVSLMDDQLSGLPSKLKAAAIHSNMSAKQREAAIEKVKSGEVHILLLSPEALVGGGHSGSGCLPPADQLPPVAFACIDEAHCVSEWSHNFRPCYLRLCKVLRDRLGVRCLLGLTATATLSTAIDIAQHLDITDQDGIAVRSAAVPQNLQLSVSMDREKDQALVSLLKGERFGSLDSIIVYCTRREETSRISALLRTCLQGVLLRESKHAPSQDSDDNPVGKKKKALARKKIRKPLKWVAESYHAGLSASERRRVQNNFMCGELRLVVATVAFGMGLDKSDVRGIVHYNMPKSFESYVQEIGRAGRDGAPAHCHLFLDPEGGDLHELRRHIHADTVDYYTVKKLVQKVFPPCKCRKIHQKQQDLDRAQEEVDDSEMMELMETCDETAAEPLGQSGGTSSHSPVEQLEQAKVHTEDKVEPTPERSAGEGNELSELDVPLTHRANGDQEVEGEEQPREVADWPTSRVCHTHERAIPIQDTVEALDVTEEGLETLLCYLELHPQQWVELLHPTLSFCKMVCYNGPQQLRKLTKICPPVAVVLARKRMANERVEDCDSLEFDVVEVADTMGWQLALVKRGLRQLQWATNRGVLVEFSNLSFYFRSYGDLTPDEMDRVCEFLHGRVVAQERTQLYQLKTSFKAFRSVAYKSCSFCTDELDEKRSLKLKELLRDYFDKRRDLDMSKKFQEDEDDEEEMLMKCKLKDWEGQIRADIQSFLGNRSDERFSGRAVARIFHGIGSPCYPAQTFGRDRRYWRKHIQFDFNELIRLATQEIIRNTRSSLADVYGDVLGHLDGEAVESVLSRLEKRVHCSGGSCEQCLSPQSVEQLLGNFTSSGGLLGKEGYFRVAAGLCLYLSSPPKTCSVIRAGRWGEETDRFIQELVGHDPDMQGAGKMNWNGKSGIQSLIRKVQKHYKHDQYKQHCLTAQDILEESNASMTDGGPDNMDVVFKHILYHVLLGDCLTARPLPEEGYFLDFIFHRLSSANNTLDELATLMKSLNLGGIRVDKDQADHMHEDQDHVHRGDGFHHGDRVSGARGAGREAVGLEPGVESHQENNSSSWDLTCFSPEELVKIHGLNSSGLSLSDIARVSPALVQQLLSGACGQTIPPTDPANQLSTTERFLYASLANLLICLLAMVGIVMLLCTSCSSAFQLVLQFCVSLAVGSLTGDALLHLLPMVLGLHHHAEGTDHGHADETPDYIYKILDNHSHHHGESEPDHCDHAKVLEMYVQDKNQKKNQQSASQTDLVASDTEKAFPGSNRRTKAQRLLPYMVTIGDAIHNFADGLAMGAAFSMSWKSGLATSLAVFCHELPHELGDFAILLHSGLSVKKALMLNFGSALTSFIGLYIALTFSTDLATQQWIGAITAGLFLYVGLADMLPTMVHADSRRPWLTFLLQNVGLLSGWAILLVLSLFEGKIGF